MKALMPLALALTLASGAGAASAQDIFAYPTANQSPDQQRKDDFECQNWAQGRTGFDPRSAPPRAVASYTPPPQQSGYFGRSDVGQGGVMRDAVGGAAMGALGGAISGNPQKGAAIGAASGALFGAMRRSSRQQEEQQWNAQQQAQVEQQQRTLNQQYAQAQGEFWQAYRSCMAGRHYEIR